jgi:N-acyl-D-aspartate/D-glutamate deacylase
LVVGKRADFNLIDPLKLALPMPVLVNDLPAGGKRFIQKSIGYLGTWVKGEAVLRNGEITKARPGKLVRMGINS